jgi:DNA-directed RNA polymerase specialized sigma24 family protein
VSTDAADDVRAVSEAAAEITAIAERVREAQLEVQRLIGERNEAIKTAVDLYHLSYRQVARAAGLTLGRVHGILAND